MRPAKTDQPAHPRSLIRVFSGMRWVAKDQNRLQVDSEDSNQAARIIVFAVHLKTVLMESGRKCSGPAQI